MVLDDWYNYYYLNLGRVAALTSKDEPDLYDNLANSFNNLKERLNYVVSRPEVKDNMFYISEEGSINRRHLVQIVVQFGICQHIGP